MAMLDGGEMMPMDAGGAMLLVPDIGATTPANGRPSPSSPMASTIQMGAGDGRRDGREAASDDWYRRQRAGECMNAIQALDQFDFLAALATGLRDAGLSYFLDRAMNPLTLVAPTNQVTSALSVVIDDENSLNNVAPMEDASNL